MSINDYPNANFYPSRGNFNELKPFKHWCQKILPLVYDDSLSYYEVLCKLTNKINEVIGAFNNEVRYAVEEYIRTDEFSDWLKLFIESRKIELKSLAVVGDSNAEGFGWWEGDPANKTDENDGYCAVLRELYPEAIIDNYSVSGAKLRGADQINAQVDTMLATEKKYQYVIIQGGMNDLADIYESTVNIVGYAGTLKSQAIAKDEDFSTMVSSLCSMCRKIRHDMPEAKILFVTREYNGGANYAYMFYNAMFAEIWKTCYLIGVPWLNLETDNITSLNIGQKAVYYYDTVHWNEKAYRDIVTPALIEFINHPVCQNPMTPKYAILYCRFDQVFHDASTAYVGGTQLEYAVEQLFQSSHYNFTGALLFASTPSLWASGIINVTGNLAFLRIFRTSYDQIVTITKTQEGTMRVYYEMVSANPQMNNNNTFSGAQKSLDNANGYGALPANQDVMHFTYNDSDGKMHKVLVGAKNGLAYRVNDPVGGTAVTYRGGLLGATGAVDLTDGSIRSGMYYVPSAYIGNITPAVPVQAGYILLIAKNNAGTTTKAFAITDNGIYTNNNLAGEWVKIQY